MRNRLPAFAAISIFVLAIVAYGEDVTPVPVDGIWALLLQVGAAIVSKQGALAVAVLAAQAALYAMRSSLGDFAGIWKVGALYLMSAGVMALQAVATGTPVVAALTSGAVLAALQHSAFEIAAQLVKVVKLPSWLLALLKLVGIGV